MSKVRVSFDIEGDDADDSTGVSNEQYEDITDAIMEVGGENIEFEPQ